MPSFQRACSAMFAGLLALGVSQPSSAESRFVVLGDLPYKDSEAAKLENEIAPAIKAGGFPFIVHYGDIKAGSAPCKYRDLVDRRDFIYGLQKGAVFYTPGDNDWTDCDRTGTNEVESLALIRLLFFLDTDSLPANPAWHVARQANYPENARWQVGDLQLATLHVVGSDNGRAEIKESKKKTTLGLVDARDRANLAWLDEAFDNADRNNAAGLVLVMHADPNDLEHPDHKDRACGPERQTKCNPHLAFITHLKARAKSFDKPALLVHGSTNPFCLDRSFGGSDAPKLWRLNGPGDGVIDAAAVHFDPDDTSRPFKIARLRKPNKDVPDGC